MRDGDQSFEGRPLVLRREGQGGGGRGEGSFWPSSGTQGDLGWVWGDGMVIGAVVPGQIRLVPTILSPPHLLLPQLSSAEQLEAAGTALRRSMGNQKRRELAAAVNAKVGSEGVGSCMKGCGGRREHVMIW